MPSSELLRNPLTSTPSVLLLSYFAPAPQKRACRCALVHDRGANIFAMALTLPVPTPNRRQTPPPAGHRRQAPCVYGKRAQRTRPGHNQTRPLVSQRTASPVCWLDSRRIGTAGCDSERALTPQPALPCRVTALLRVSTALTRARRATSRCQR